MKVVAWVPQVPELSPGQRFRIEQWAPYLAADHGINVSYSPFAREELTRWLGRSGRWADKAWHASKALGRRLAESVRETGADLVYVFREDALLGPAIAARLLGLRRTPFVFDFDDAVFIRYVSPANGLLAYLRFPGKTASLCRRAGHVLAGNAVLAAYARRFTDRVSIIPTTIDTKLYRPRGRTEPDGELIVGWSGSFSTVQHLEFARPALQALAQRRRFKLRVIGGEGVAIPGVQVECRPWRAETEIADIASFDIGIMPLPDDPWTWRFPQW
jgi:glycosyltransferase involved in cell wall biosynthesis